MRLPSRYFIPQEPAWWQRKDQQCFANEEQQRLTGSGGWILSGPISSIFIFQLVFSPLGQTYDFLQWCGLEHSDIISNFGLKPAHKSTHHGFLGPTLNPVTQLPKFLLVVSEGAHLFDSKKGLIKIFTSGQPKSSPQLTCEPGLGNFPSFFLIGNLLILQDEKWSMWLCCCRWCLGTQKFASPDWTTPSGRHWRK